VFTPYPKKYFAKTACNAIIGKVVTGQYLRIDGYRRADGFHPEWACTEQQVCGADTLTAQNGYHVLFWILIHIAG